MKPAQYTFLAALKTSEKHGEYYQHFGLHPSLLSIYGVTKEDLRIVTLEVIPEVNLDNRVPTNDIDYWGLLEIGKEQPIMIYPSFAQFSVCFPYGAKSAEEQGRCKCLNMKVISVHPYDKD